MLWGCKKPRISIFAIVQLQNRLLSLSLFGDPHALQKVVKQGLEGNIGYNRKKTKWMERKILIRRGAFGPNKFCSL